MKRSQLASTSGLVELRLQTTIDMYPVGNIACHPDAGSEKPKCLSAAHLADAVKLYQVLHTEQRRFTRPGHSCHRSGTASRQST
jgi:hypothetical protein